METTHRIDLGDVTLSCAVTGEGPLVIAAHGFPDDATTFRAQVPPLVAAGFRLAVPTMRGYAPSSPSRSGRYDVPALAGDLVALADALSPAEPVRLIGHDWGALAGFAATAIAPARFSHFASMAVPHPRGLGRHFATLGQLRRSWYIGFFQLRGVADAVVRARDFAFIDRLWRDWSPGYHATRDELAAVKAGIRGRVGEVLGYYRAAFSPGAFSAASRRLLLGRTTVPSIHLHGVDDGCMGVACAAGQEGCYAARYALHRVERAGHFLQRERPEEVNRALLGFFGAR